MRPNYKDGLVDVERKNMKYQILLKAMMAAVTLMLYVCLCSCDEIDYFGGNEFSHVQNETQNEEITTDFSETIANQNEWNNENLSPELLRTPTGFNNQFFYVYHLAPRASDSENAQFMSWEFVSGEDKKHNEWIETQTFTSLFRYRDKCIRAGYVNETGQWGVTFFDYHGLYTEYVGAGQSLGTTITYPLDETWLIFPGAFGISNDHSVEITSFDEIKHTVTLTFVSPEGETTDVYINYLQWLRCDENGTLLTDVDGNPFLYRYDGDYFYSRHSMFD